MLHLLRARDQVDTPQESGIDVVDRLEESGSPHDAAGRFLRLLVQHRAPEGIPGGLPEDTQRFLSTALATVLNPEHCVPMEVLIQIAITARREHRELSQYERALYSFAEQNGDYGSSVLRYLRCVASGNAASKELDDLPPEYRALFSEVIQALAAESLDCTPWELGAAALRARRGGSMEPKHAAYLERALNDSGLNAEIGRFFSGLADPGRWPDVPSGIPFDLQYLFHDLRFLAAVNMESWNPSELAQSALACRVRGEVFSEEEEELLDVLMQCGGPHADVCRFFRELAVSGSFPSLPAGIPSEFFVLLASARREAQDIENVRIGVVRDSRQQADGQHDGNSLAEPE